MERKVIETGYLRQKVDDGPTAMTNVPYKMQYLHQEDLPQIMALQEYIWHRLTRTDLLEKFPEDFMAEHIDEKGFIIGVMVNDELVAFRNAYYPAENDHEWNLGYDIGLNQKADLCRVANLQMVCVHPHFRGNALALRMNRVAIEQIKALNHYRYLCATVSPYNYWNVRILLKSGFVVKALKDKYQGKLRYVVCQYFETDHSENSTLVGVAADNKVNIRLTDIDRQHDLIEKGFVGIELNPIASVKPLHYMDNAHGFELVYARL